MSPPSDCQLPDGPKKPESRDLDVYLPPTKAESQVPISLNSLYLTHLTAHYVNYAKIYLMKTVLMLGCQN